MDKQRMNEIEAKMQDLREELEKAKDARGRAIFGAISNELPAADAWVADIKAKLAALDAAHTEAFEDEDY